MRIGVQSIRLRLTFWYTLLVLSTLLAFGGASYYYTNKTLTENLDTSLRNEVRWVRDCIEPQASKVRRKSPLVGGAKRIPRLGFLTAVCNR